MRFTTLLNPLALAATVLGDYTAIVASISDINKSTLKLQTNVNNWKGNLLGTLPIISESTALLEAIKKGTKTSKASEALNFTGALYVAEGTISLANSVNATMTALIAAKPKFNKLLLGPIILVNLGLQKSATDDFSAAILTKVPADLKAVAESLIAPIDKALEKAIDEFRHFP
ncbi:hydrophobic surface binding protein A-domain-containing protein [Podospora didyma]|uniref:Hydrophobic surface binding protein A-domain-containing protein n=1 Tax=Podospora didyma TaxID=330526 RepID=A0AAE0NWT6_9PEZI|nr:hydrophobic surface binding protein A-domain-containing protein [Podospora didyma]